MLTALALTLLTTLTFNSIGEGAAWGDSRRVTGAIPPTSVVQLQQTDTTITVAAGTRLDVHNQGGEIVVESWNRDEVRIQAVHGSRDQIQVETSGSVVEVRSRSRVGAGIVDYHITVPAGMHLELGGLYTNIRVEGTSGQITANTVHGDIHLRGGSGRLEARTVQGQVVVEDAQADVLAVSVAGDVELRNIRGAVSVESVSGRLSLEGIDSENVRGETVSGSVDYDGSIRPEGRYAFASHSGTLTIAVPESLNATVNVATFTGRVESSFGSLASTPRSRGWRERFTQGDGSALIEIESFSGAISIVTRAEGPLLR